MGIEIYEPTGLNFMEVAERVYCEGLILHRIDAVLSSAHIERLEEGRVQQLKGLFIHHVDLMRDAHSEWKLGNDHLEECLAHFDRVGLSPKHSKDLVLIRQMEELLAIISDIITLEKLTTAIEDDFGVGERIAGSDE